MSKVSKFLFFVVILLAMAELPATAAGIQITARFEPSNPIVNQVIHLVVEIESDQEVADPNKPQLKPFEIVASKTSKQISVINGVKTVVKRFRYSIELDDRAGTFSFPAVKLNHDGKTYSSNPLKLAIAKIANDDSRSEAPYFATAKINKSELYLGEQGLLEISFSTGRKLVIFVSVLTTAKTLK